MRLEEYLHHFKTNLVLSKKNVDQLSEFLKNESIEKWNFNKDEFHKLTNDAKEFVIFATSKKGKFLNMIKSNFPELFNN